MPVVEVNDGDFEEKILKSEIPALVDFWAPWCAPCHVMTPVLKEFADDFEGRVVVGKLNVEENQETAMKYEITGIPTMILFISGEAVEQIVGVTAKEELAAQVGSHLGG